MQLRLIYITVLLFISYSLFSQIFPQPGATLNFTQVMFQCQNVKGATGYTVQITEDEPGSSFQHPLFEQTDLSTATLINNLKFGKKYLWRYAAKVPAPPRYGTALSTLKLYR